MNGLRGAAERVEERVALGVDLVAAAPGERVAEEALMVGEHSVVPIAQASDQLRGALDVREHERHGAAWETGHTNGSLTPGSCELQPARFRRCSLMPRTSARTVTATRTAWSTLRSCGRGTASAPLRSASACSEWRPQLRLSCSWRQTALRSSPT